MGNLEDSTSEELLRRYKITDTDLKNVRKYGKIVGKKIPQFLEYFYSWLKKEPEFEEFFPDDSTLVRVKKKQEKYWQQFYAAEINEEYVAYRVRIGEIHAQIGLPLGAYLGSMNESFRYQTEEMYDNSLSEAEYIACLQAMTRLLHLDVDIVANRHSQVIIDTVAAQSRSLMEMSTPVTQLWDGILMLPVVGIMDSKRAQDMMTAILRSIVESQSKHFILDISGVAVVDTAVANHLIKITKATSLMGCECIITGISPAIAQTIVELGINVGTVQTTASMKDALALVFREQGVDQPLAA